MVLFDGVLGHLIFESLEGDVGGVEVGSWKVKKGELGLGGKPFAISFKRIMKEKLENGTNIEFLIIPVH